MQPHAQSCLRLTSSPLSYSDKLCPSEFNIYTFLCDVNSTDAEIILAFNTIHRQHYYAHNGYNETEYRGYTDEYEYHFSLPLSKRLTDYYTMRSSLTVRPQNSMARFPVSCTTYCGHTFMVERKTYTLAGG